jgi:hypothetical protein
MTRKRFYIFNVHWGSFHGGVARGDIRNVPRVSQQNLVSAISQIQTNWSIKQCNSATATQILHYIHLQSTLTPYKWYLPLHHPTGQDRKFKAIALHQSRPRAGSPARSQFQDSSCISNGCKLQPAQARGTIVLSPYTVIQRSQVFHQFLHLRNTSLRKTLSRMHRTWRYSADAEWIIKYQGSGMRIAKVQAIWNFHSNHEIASQEDIDQVYWYEGHRPRRPIRERGIVNR